MYLAVRSNRVPGQDDPACTDAGFAVAIAGHIAAAVKQTAEKRTRTATPFVGVVDVAV